MTDGELLTDSVMQQICIQVNYTPGRWSLFFVVIHCLLSIVYYLFSSFNLAQGEHYFQMHSLANIPTK